MTKQKKRLTKGTQKKLVSPFKNYWTKENYIIFGLGFVVLIIGFYLMTMGPWDNPLSLTVSPIVLLIAYFLIFPLSIFYKGKKTQKESAENVSRQD